MTSPYDNMDVRDLYGRPLSRERRWSFKAGDRVLATAGKRRGQIGRLIEPIGVETSWVRWSRTDQTTYPHHSLRKQQSPSCVQARPADGGGR